jgi:V/A-type H+/Na+-transporting ATPase subunit I
MSIVRLQKVTLYGLASQRDEVLDRLQGMGCLHLIDLPGKGDTKTLEPGERMSVQQAINYLQASPSRHPQPHGGYSAGDDCVAIAQNVHRNELRRAELQDEQDRLEQGIENVLPWGEFRLPEESETGGLLFWFYAVPPRQLKIFSDSGLAWQKISQDRQFVYVLVLSSSEPRFGLQRISLDRRPLSELKKRLSEVMEELAALDEQRYSLTRWLDLLGKDLDRADDEIRRKQAVGKLFEDEKLFALQGWAPGSVLPALEAFARKHGLALTIAPPRPDEQPPTLMKNPVAVAGAEGAVSFYITPGYRAWDPTWVMYFSFAFFFAMIMSDAAYGAIMGLALSLLWRRLGQSEQGRKMRYLFLGLTVATIVWGVAIGSYFGATPKSLEFLQLKVEGKPLANHQDAMMMLSLAIGVFHLCLANLISAWQNRHRLAAFCPIGWATALLGGFATGLFSAPTNKASLWLGQWLGQDPGSFQPQLKQFGTIGLIVGLAMVFLFSSSRPLMPFRPGQWLLRVFDGFLGLTKVSAAFGDTLSYLRLFALGLASAQLAVTFNNLALGMMQGPGLGFLLAIVILVVGHGINIVLGIMGGVVHGLRLNCIEFFNWSLTEEGYPFRPFNKKAG